MMKSSKAVVVFVREFQRNVRLPTRRSTRCSSADDFRLGRDPGGTGGRGVADRFCYADFPVTYLRVAQLDAEVWTSEKRFRTLLALLSIIRYAACVEAIGEGEG